MNLKPLLSLIAQGEVGGAARHQRVASEYDVVWSGIPAGLRPLKLSDMTVGQVLDWQDDVVRAGSKSSAAGRYQIIRKTLRGLIEQGACKTTDTYDAETQDRLAVALLRGRGLDAWQAGKISDEAFANRLAMEWASLPVIGGPKHGQSFYAGDGLNSAHIKPEAVLAALAACRAPVAPTPRPVEPAPSGGLLAAIWRILGAIFGGNRNA